MRVVATLLVAIFSALVDETTNASDLVNNLKRQLMRDNSDYSLEDENKTDSFQMRANSEFEESHETNKVSVVKHRSHSTKVHNKKQTPVNDDETFEPNFYVPGLTNAKMQNSTTSLKKKYSRNVEHFVSNRDLLYYMDDQKLLPKSKQKTEHTQNRKNIGNNGRWKTKYNFLKLKRNYRRNYQPRLIQEESAGKVAIMNLDKGPIPELRLPRSRRQYMRDPGEVVADDEEIPPPQINSSEPEAAPSEEFTSETMIPENKTKHTY